eukprot:CAMPEP_0201871110 /NCGR_PEP_ID=MMETSP0902-20130614/4108_1 /ASSEMBLY_ACC=CAM_ASM_000551 /TAXON_ID=420261 /ORGANISM="Thalassiosira antarctica, Strain CCMP982" /LENGTH=94 /DNA_ID=CAMNT_0048397001 /DNA_START=369 /DNA_END=653 /DNA_ORIENTATION=-
MTGASNTNGGRGGSGGSNNDESMGEGMSRKRSSNDLDGSNTGGSTSVSYPSNVTLACRATNVGRPFPLPALLCITTTVVCALGSCHTAHWPLDR